MLTCERCGRPVEKEQSLVVPDGENFHLLCFNCGHPLNRCDLCKRGGECDFETNPLAEPKYIQKQVRQGFQTIVVKEKNPERIRQTCQVNCPCYDPENDCMKQYNYCERIEHIYE